MNWIDLSSKLSGIFIEEWQVKEFWKLAFKESERNELDDLWTIHKEVEMDYQSESFNQVLK